MGEVFYAIDMGAPSGKYSGFYCWRYDLSSKKLESFDKTDGWYKCIEQIVEDTKNYQVHLTIEAALWGMKNRKSGDWVRRFNIENEKEWSERPWYTGAGASTGLMAQIFLNNIVELNPPKSRIIVRESYISGLSREGSSLTVKKPTKALVSFKTKHACDAFEGLLLTLEITKKNLKYIDFNYKGYPIDLKNWIDLKNNFFKIKMRDDEPFALGILKDSNVFTFNLGEILFTRRDFGILPKK